MHDIDDTRQHQTGLIRMGVLLIVLSMHELTDSSTMGESATQRDSVGTPKAQGVAYGRCGRWEWGWARRSGQAATGHHHDTPVDQVRLTSCTATRASSSAG